MNHNKQCIPELLLNSFSSVRSKIWNVLVVPDFGAKQIRDDFMVQVWYNEYASSSLIISVAWVHPPASYLLHTFSLHSSCCYLHVPLPRKSLTYCCISPELCISIHIQNKTFLFYSMYSQNLSFSWDMECPKTKILCISLNVSKILHKIGIHIFIIQIRVESYAWK